MDANEIKELLHAVPFKPFTVHMANDRACTVQHPDFGWLTPNGRTFIVGPPPSEERGINLLDVRLIARITTEDALAT